MKSRYYFTSLAVLILSVTQLATGTALDDYVAAPDPSYDYNVVKTLPGPGYIAYIIEMTSQTWRGEDEVDRTLWKHWLTIIKPNNATSDTALLWINGGSNRRSAPDSPDKMLAGIAMTSNAVVADIKQVPNQPLTFPDGGGPRSEDGIIAYTFVKFMSTGDATWPLLLPMVKSAVRAMDTVQKHLSSLDTGALDIEHFVISGGSKRGWTTWLTAAVDQRVVAIAPAVIDVLNMDEQMKHQFEAYGFYSQAVADYDNLDIFDKLGSPEAKPLLDLVDPYEYRDRYATIPKFMINSSGDQFFLPDSAQFYFDDLPGEKYIRYVPNTDHGLDGSDAPQSLLSFFKSVLTKEERPTYSWTVKDDHSIVVETPSKPSSVKLWQATNPKARDFRLETIGKVWESSDLSDQGSGAHVYVAKVPAPAEGWTAFFIELSYPSGSGFLHKFTTEVHVVPDRLPFAK
ncbi:MAG: PhoPQ-activated pathogenicity-related family protein [Sedimentisphaerales bacterium]|nr:PhoPQ-activated pathogenicity-related family protein [Sedimentisphaerales bacterium]